MDVDGGGPSAEETEELISSWERKEKIELQQHPLFNDQLFDLSLSVLQSANYLFNTYISIANISIVEALIHRALVRISSGNNKVRERIQNVIDTGFNTEFQRYDANNLDAKHKVGMKVLKVIRNIQTLNLSKEKEEDGFRLGEYRHWSLFLALRLLSLWGDRTALLIEKKKDEDQDPKAKSSSEQVWLEEYVKVLQTFYSEEDVVIQRDALKILTRRVL